MIRSVFHRSCTLPSKPMLRVAIQCLLSRSVLALACAPTPIPRPTIQSPQATTTEQQPPLARSVPQATGVPNFAWIHAGLARGGQPDDKEGLQYLRQQGFRTIINLR